MPPVPNDQSLLAAGGGQAGSYCKFLMMLLAYPKNQHPLVVLKNVQSFLRISLCVLKWRYTKI